MVSSPFSEPQPGCRSIVTDDRVDKGLLAQAGYLRRKRFEHLGPFIRWLTREGGEVAGETQPVPRVIMRHLHDEIDRTVADAYGWPADLPDAEILTRLVALD